jgi:hypothetical protein
VTSGNAAEQSLAPNAATQSQDRGHFSIQMRSYEILIYEETEQSSLAFA